MLEGQGAKDVREEGGGEIDERREEEVEVMSKLEGREGASILGFSKH